MVHGKGIGFFLYKEKGRVMHIAMHVKSTKKITNARCDLFRSVMVSKRKARFIECSFGPSTIVRLFHPRFFHGTRVVNGRRVPLDMTDSKRKRK